MSKKMLKRSLVLGVLMTFVITGSVYAEQVLTTLNGDYEVNVPTDSSYGHQDAEEVEYNKWASYMHCELDGNKLTFKYGFVDEGECDFEGFYITDNNASKRSELIVEGSGITGKGVIDVDYLSVDSKTTGIDAAGSITVDELKVTSVNNAIGAVSRGKLTINAPSIELVVGASGNAIQANNDLEINGDMLNITNVEGSTYQRTIRVAGATANIDVGSLNISGATEAGKVTGSGTLILSADTGNIVSDFEAGEKGSNGTVNMTLGSGVTLTGSVVTDTEGTGDNASSSILTLNGATWNVTGASNVSEIAGNDAKLKVEDAKAAEGWVQVDKVSATELTVATETDDSKTQETLDALAKVAVYSGDTGKSAATQVQLKNAIYDNVVADVTADGVKITDSEVASANVSVNDMVAIGMMSWRAEMNDMNKRMGELRNANGEHGVWVRMVRGESEYNSVKNQYNQYQLGYDEKLSVDKRWTVGAAISYTDAENNFAEGTGESTNKAFSVYGSKLNDDGTFVDLIAKYARLDNDFKTLQGQGAAEYDTNAYSFSAEVGKRIQQGKGLWIEPQVELTYGKVSAVDYVTDKGVNVAQDGMESLVGRIGFSLGKDIEKGNVYARASYLYDFDGETKAVLDGDAVLTNDLGGGWWEVGVGANINLSKATYIYADVEKTFGGEVDTNWQWNLGVRYSF